MEKETMVATVPQAKIVDEQQLSRDVTDIEFQAESLVIQSDEDYAFAGEFGKMLKKKASQVTTFFKPMKDSAYQAHKAVCDREKAMLTPLRNAEKTVKQVMSAYIAEQERKRREAEEAARRAAEAERERKIQEAATLEAAGDADGAEAAFEEAAIMDGASQWRILWQIFVPTSTAALATIALYSTVYHWNEWFNGIIYSRGPEQYPLQSYMRTIVIDQKLTQMGAGDWEALALVSDKTVKCAMIFVACFPMLMLYPFLQRYFVKGMVLGSVKG